MKKILSLFLAVMMVVSLCPISAWADDANPIELPQLIEQEEQQEELPEPAEEQPVEEQPAEEQEPQEEQGLNTIDFGNSLAAPAETNAEGSSEGWNGVTTKEPEKVDGVYQIGTAEELAWLSAKIDTGTQVDMSAVLTADINLNNKNFMPIANNGREYRGVFDGQDHVIYNVLIEKDGFIEFAAVFGTISKGSTVKNLGVESATIKNTAETVRSIAGFCSVVSAGAKIENCYIKDFKVDAYSCYSFQGVGAGFCGENAGEIKNCYAINGTVTDQGEKGDRNRAFVSTNTGMIENCYAANVTVNQTPAITEYFGGEAKETKDENIKNCYILSADGITSVNAEVKDEAWFKSSAAAALGDAWKNDSKYINGGFPILKFEGGEDEPEGWNGVTTKEPATIDGVYQIGTAEELAWLSAKIDTGSMSDMSAVLTADIDLNNKNFMPIANNGREYRGVFDGQDHVIYNVLIEKDGFIEFAAVFGTISNGSTVKNLGVESATIKNTAETVRSIAGFCSVVSAGAKIENCYIKDFKVDAYSCYSFQGVGAGFCGENAGEIKNCYAINGTVTDQGEKGDRNRAFVSTNTGMIENCYAANVTVNQTPAITEYFGGEAKETKDENIKNCYILSADGITSVNAEVKDEAWFKSSAAAALGSAWKNDTEGKNNGFPMLKTEEDLNKPIPWDGTTTKEPEKVDGVYQIGTAEELAWLSAKIDTGTQADMSVVLTADIDMGNKNFMPIAEGREYIGVFDGQNHVIYNVLVETDSFGAYCGLFGVIAKDSTVKNLGVESIMVKNKSENVRTTAGFCSKVSAGAKVENCYVKDVKIDAYSCYSFQGVGAGFCGDNAGEIKNCYVINGTVTDQCEKGDRNRAFVSTNTGMIENCYAANVTVNQTPAITEYFGGEAKETKDENIKNCYILSADGITSVNAEVKDEAWFKSSAAAALGSAWENDAEGKNNGFPVLKASGESGGDEGPEIDPKGWDGESTTSPSMVNGVYQIGGPKELAGFAKGINNGTIAASANAVLTADISLNNRNWTPIGSGTRVYSGFFDGQGHIISNLYIDRTDAESMTGLFGQISKGNVRNIGIASATIKSSVEATKPAAVFCAINNQGRIDGCFINGGNVKANSASAEQGAGAVFCGENSGKITNCYVTDATVEDQSANGSKNRAFVSINTGAIENCYAAKVSVNQTAAVTEIFAGEANDGNIKNCYVVPSGSAASSNAEVKDEAWLKSAAAVEALGIAWEKDAGNNNGGFPVLKEDRYKPESDPNGWDGTTLKEPELVGDVYQIGTAEELAWFIQKKSSGKAKAVLTADIDLNNREWTAVGVYSGTFDGQNHVISNLYLRNTNPRSSYAGLFARLDNGGIVKNLGVTSATAVETSNGVSRMGVICGSLDNSHSKPAIENCYVKDSRVVVMSGNAYDEGSGAVLCGYNYGIIKNCYVINCTVEDMGVAGTHSAAISPRSGGTVENCYAVNVTINQMKPVTDGFVYKTGFSSAVKNCYMLSSEGAVSKTAALKDEAWFKSLDAVIALGGAFKKDTEGKNNGYPVLKNADEPQIATKRFYVALTDGTQMHPEQIANPESIEYKGVTYPSEKIDYVDGFWKVTVPAGTTELKFSVDNLKNIETVENKSDYAFFATWHGELQVVPDGSENKLNIDPTFFGDYAYGITTLPDYKDYMLETEYSDGYYTIPLEKMKRTADEMTDVEKQVWGETGNYNYAVVYMGTFEKGSHVNGFDAVLLVQIGSTEVTDTVDRSEMEQLLARVEDDTTAYYTEGDRYNGKEDLKQPTSLNSSFWKKFIANGGARAKARKALASAQTQEELDAAVAKLKEAMGKLVSTKNLNTTDLYELMHYIQWESQSIPGLEAGYPVANIGSTASYYDRDAIQKYVTAKSWEKFVSTYEKAETLMAELYDAEGNPTEANTSSRKEELSKLETELSVARKLLDVKYNKDSDEAKSEFTFKNSKLNYFLKKFDPEKMKAADYTAESFEKLKETRKAAIAARETYMTDDDLGCYDANMFKGTVTAFVKACYGLTDSKENITVHFSFVDGTGAYTGMKYNEAPISDMVLTIPANSTPVDAMKAAGASFYRYNREDNIFYAYINGEVLGAINSTNEMSQNELNDVILNDGDDVMIYYFRPKLVKYSSGAGSYPALFSDIYGWVKYATISAPEEVTAGVPFDISVTADGAYYTTITGKEKPVEGARVYTNGDSFSDRNNAARANVLEYSYINTDENGNAQITLYGEGWTAINVYVLDKGDEGRYVHCKPVLVYVKASDDLEGIKKTLQAELDAAWNNENYTEPVFTAGNWKIYKKAYEDGTAGVTAATTGAEARKAQFTALKTMLEKQKQADSDNTNRLKNVRDCLKALPDDVTKLNTSMKGRIDQMIYNYNAMSDYARSQLTVREQKKYDAIVEAYNKGLGEGSAYAVSSEIRYAGVPDADREALKNMIEYLRKNTPNDDAYTPEIGNNRIAELFSFNKGSSRNYGTQYTTVTEAKSFDSIVAPINPDYTAYLLVRNANGKLSGDGWEITDENVTIDFDPNNSNTATLVGHLTYKVNGHEYEVKGYSVRGADKSNYSVVSGYYYECSTYKGKGVNNINFYVPSALIRMDMAYEPVKLIVTWAPAGGSESELAKAKASAIEVITVEYNKYSADHEKHDAIQKAFDDGVAAVNAATTLAGVAKARTDAVKAIRAAAGIGATGEPIPGWGEDSEFDAGKQVGTVTVSLENTKYDDGYFYTEEGEKPFLYKENYPLGENDTMMSVLCRAMADEKIEWVGSGGGYEITYLSSISQTDENGVTHSLGEFDGGNESGWMGTLNDWFTNLGFSEFTVANGTLGDGDYISIKYTQSGLGADLGGTWDNSDTTLKDLVVEGGTLLTKFTSGESGKTYEYTVSIEGTSASLKVTPTATNKNFLTKIFLNEQVNSNEEGASFYKRTQYIPVTSGDTIYVGCGMRAWPSMNNQSGNTQSNEGTWYVLHVVNGDDGSDYVIDLINNLPAASSINYNNYKEKNVDIEAARAAYEALTADAKAKVTNYETLTKLEAVIKSFDDVEVFKAQLAAIPSADKITLEHREAVEAAQAVYDALSETQKENLTLAEHAKMKALTERIKELEKAAAEAVDKLIEAIGDVELTDECKARIDAARAAYDALTDKQKELVTKDDVLKAAEAAYAKLADEAAAKAVENMIAALPEADNVALTDEASIVAARSAYDKLTNTQKAFVPNKAKLEAAENKLAELKAIAAKEEADRKAAQSVTDMINALPQPIKLEDKASVEAARAAYDNLTADQKKFVSVGTLKKLTDAEAEIVRLEKERDDKAAAAVVEKLIANIGTVTIESKPTIDTARNAYDKLTEAQKKFVSNYGVLTAAEAKYEQLVNQAAADHVKELVESLTPVTLNSGNAIKAARKAFDALTPEQKKLLDPKTEDKLVAAENEYKKLVKEDADKKAAKEVEDKIAALQPVTKDSGEAIKDARSSYEALTPEQKALVSKDSVAALDKAEKVYDMIIAGTKPGTAVGDNTGSTSGSGVIKITANGDSKGEKNPNTGAPVMSMAPAVLVLAAAALVLKKHK